VSGAHTVAGSQATSVAWSPKWGNDRAARSPSTKTEQPGRLDPRVRTGGQVAKEDSRLEARSVLGNDVEEKEWPSGCETEVPSGALGFGRRWGFGRRSATG
jgi:hypothetical protein